MPNLQAFLDGLAAEAGRTLPPDEAAAFVAEAREHLEESIQARLELGMAPDEAEREALALFGAARAVIEEVRRREPRFDRRFFVLASAVVLVFVVFGGGRSFPGWAAVPILGTALALHVAYWVRSAQLRRPQLAALAAVFLPLWIALGTVRGVADAAFVRDNIEGGFARNRAWHRVLARKERSLEKAYAEFRRAPGALGPSRVPAYGPTGEVRLVARRSAAEAAARWPAALANGRRNLEGERRRIADSDLDQAALARTTPFGFTLRAMGAIFATVGWGPAAFYGGTHLLAWGIGWASRRRRRDERPLSA